MPLLQDVCTIHLHAHTSLVKINHCRRPPSPRASLHTVTSAEIADDTDNNTATGRHLSHLCNGGRRQFRRGGRLERRTTDGGRTDEERRSAVSRGESERDHCRICRRRSRRSPPTDRPTFRFQPKRTCASRPLPPSLLVAIRMIHQAAARLRSSVRCLPFRSLAAAAVRVVWFCGRAERACVCVRAFRSKPTKRFLSSVAFLSSFFLSFSPCIL